MSQRVLSWVGAALLAPHLLQCTAEDDADPPGSEDTTGNSEADVRDFCARYAEITCEAAEGCACLTGDPPEICKSRQETFCWDDVGLAVASGRMDFDRTIVDGCLAELESEWSACASGQGPWPEACLDLVAGRMTEGDTCDDDRECVAPFACWDSVCTKTPAEGEACLEGLCGDGLFCTEDDRCELPGSMGDTCVEGDGACASGHYCDPRTSTCERVLPEGGTCTHAASACGAGFFCSEAVGTCRHLPVMDESCEDSAGACGDGAYCDESFTCQPKLATGASCAGDDDCLSDRCDDDECGFIVGSVCGY
jgi:hypothetical protein